MWLKTKKVLGAGWKNFISNKAISLGNVFVLVLTIYVFGATLFVKDLAVFLEDYLQKKVEISIWFKEQATENEALNLKKELSEKFPFVSIDYFSKEMVLKKFKEKFKESTVLMEALKEFDNPFTSYLKIKAKDPKDFEQISSFLENSEWKDIIERVDFSSRKEFIEKIFKFAEFLKKSLISLSVFMVLVSVIVTFNSIRLSILKSAEEIKIQKLVGASDAFVRGPFLVQGFLWATLASLLAAIFLSCSVYFLSQKTIVFSEEFNLWALFEPKMITIFLWQFFFAFILTLASSYVSTSKYVKI